MKVRRGFTLIELLVVIAIIAVLIALLAAGGAVGPRGGPPQPVHNNLKQLALALHNYTSATGAFPPGIVNTTTYLGQSPAELARDLDGLECPGHAPALTSSRGRSTTRRTSAGAAATSAPRPTRPTRRSTTPGSPASSARPTGSRVSRTSTAIYGSIGTSTIQYPADGNTTGVFRVYNSQQRVQLRHPRRDSPTGRRTRSRSARVSWGITARTTTTGATACRACRIRRGGSSPIRCAGNNAESDPKNVLARPSGLQHLLDDQRAHRTCQGYGPATTSA